MNNMVFEPGQCLAGSQMLYQGKTLLKLSRHTEVFQQISSEIKEQCLGRWIGYEIWTFSKGTIYTKCISICTFFIK